MQPQKIVNENDWAQFALSYIYLAQLACAEMLNRKYEERSFSIGYLYIPATYNLKHAIEIFIKALTIEFSKKDAMSQADKIHDLDSLFSELKKNVSEKSLHDSIKEWKAKFPKHADASKHGSSSVYSELEGLIRKYQSLEFLKEKIGTDYIIGDFDNTAFKYPTNNLTIQVNYEKITPKFEMIDVLRLESDALTLEILFWQFHTLLHVHRSRVI